MSHVATVEVVVKDLEAFAAACAEIGMEFVEGKQTFKWFGKWVNDYAAQDAAYRQGIDPKTYGQCAHAARVKGNASAYEVGLVAKESGGYALAFDFWHGGYGLEAVAGAKCAKLVSAYVQQVTRKTLARQGYAFRGIKTNVDGSTEMVFTHA